MAEGYKPRTPDEAQPAMFSLLLTFLGIRSQDLSKCSSSKLWGKHNPFQSGALLGPSYPLQAERLHPPPREEQLPRDHSAMSPLNLRPEPEQQ